jgi:uncharacterized membrane protein YkvA (DUF1232 family)
MPRTYMRGMDIVSSDSFWTKIRHTIGKVPFADRVVALWVCARDPATPLRVKAILWGAIAYFVLPFDIIPDLLAGIGYADDAAVVAAALRAVLPYVTDSHRDQARRILAGQTVDRGDVPT